jgi:hypothetical protein
MTNKTPISLFLTRVISENPALSTVKCEVAIVHPNETSNFGQEFVSGKKGSRLIAEYKGETWEVIRGNNTHFFKNYDKIKKAFWWPKRREGTYWFCDAGRVNAWSAAWK